MVVGLNYRTAPVAVRERFWISENRRYEALVQLSRAEGIDEVIVMATCNRTEFWLWANDVTLAANSVMRLLGSEYGLMLCEWKHFYRLLDEAALLHIFRVASSLDSMVVGEPQVVSQVKASVAAGAEGWRYGPVSRCRVAEGTDGLEARAHGDGDWQRGGFHSLCGRGTRAADLRHAGKQESSSARRGQDERTLRPWVAQPRRQLRPRDQPHAGACRGAGRETGRTRDPV